MDSRLGPILTVVCAVATLGICGAFTRPPQSNSTGSGTSAKALILEKNDGELRTRRIHTDSSVPASTQFMLKVSPKNNGSQNLVAGTEVLPPGATLPKHRHLLQDEILLIQSGTAHVSLGEEERD